MRKNRESVQLVLMVFVAVLLAVPAAAQAPGTKAVTDRIAETYDVTVLKTAEGESNGKRVLFVTVMKGGGNSNDAFQVTTLEVDPETGELISQYRTTPTGQMDEGPGPRQPSIDESGQIIRQWSTRSIGR